MKVLTFHCPKLLHIEPFSAVCHSTGAGKRGEGEKQHGKFLTTGAVHPTNEFFTGDALVSERKYICKLGEKSVNRT